MSGKSDRRYYRDLVARYGAATGRTEYEAADVVAWAATHGERLEMSSGQVREFHVGRVSEALRSHKCRDARGRKVRLHHCVVVAEHLPGQGKKTQRTIWSHVDDARDEFLRQSLLQRRRGIAADVDSLRADLDAINDRRAERGRRPINMTFDFSDGEAGGAAGA